LHGKKTRVNIFLEFNSTEWNWQAIVPDMILQTELGSWFFAGHRRRWVDGCKVDGSRKY